MGKTVVVPPHVYRLAQILKRLTPQEMEQLVELVPELKRAEMPKALEEEMEAASRLRRLAMELTRGEMPSRRDEFIGGLTYEEFFSLSEEEQDAIWERIFGEEKGGPYDLGEHNAKTDTRVAAG